MNDIQDYIDRYLRGEMTRFEREKFLKMAANDADISSELNIAKCLVAGISDRARKHEIITSWKTTKKRMPVLRNVQYGVAGIAAMLAIGIIVIHNDAGVENAEMNVGTTSVESHKVYLSNTQIMQMFLNGQYEQCLESIDQIETQLGDGVISTELLMIKAKSLIELSRIEEAKNVLGLIIRETERVNQNADSLLNALITGSDKNR